MLADMIQAQQAPRARTIEVGLLQRRLELARLMTTGDGALAGRAFDPAMKFSFSRRHASSLNRSHYIGVMNAPSTGPVATEMLNRLEAALAPSRVELVDDSEKHRGHGGYNPAGESHFSLAIESAAFAGKSRIERQRLVHAALGELVGERVHALSIKARAPGE